MQRIALFPSRSRTLVCSNLTHSLFEAYRPEKSCRKTFLSKGIKPDTAPTEDFWTHGPFYTVKRLSTKRQTKMLTDSLAPKVINRLSYVYGLSTLETGTLFNIVAERNWFSPIQ